MIASIKRAVRGLWNMTNFDELALNGGPVSSVARPAAAGIFAGHRRGPVGQPAQLLQGALGRGGILRSGLLGDLADLF